MLSAPVRGVNGATPPRLALPGSIAEARKNTGGRTNVAGAALVAADAGRLGRRRAGRCHRGFLPRPPDAFRHRLEQWRRLWFFRGPPPPPSPPPPSPPPPPP